MLRNLLHVPGRYRALLWTANPGMILISGETNISQYDISTVFYCCFVPPMEFFNIEGLERRRFLLLRIRESPFKCLSMQQLTRARRHAHADNKSQCENQQDQCGNGAEAVITFFEKNQEHEKHAENRQ